MKAGCVKMGFLLLAITAVALGIGPVYGAVESVELLPSVLVVGQSIIFFGQVSGSTIGTQLAVHVYAGANCPASSPIASTYTISGNETQTIANNTIAIYNVTLTFPVTSSSGWVVEQQYQNELPAGAYSVGVEQVGSGSGLCKNFTVQNQPVAEFPNAAPTLLLTVLAPLYLMRRRTARSSIPATFDSSRCLFAPD
jgi:hypothetical protein